MNNPVGSAPSKRAVVAKNHVHWDSHSLDSRRMHPKTACARRSSTWEKCVFPAQMYFRAPAGCKPNLVLTTSQPHSNDLGRHHPFLTQVHFYGRGEALYRYTGLWGISRDIQTKISDTKPRSTPSPRSPPPTKKKRSSMMRSTSQFAWMKWVSTERFTVPCGGPKESE